MNITPPSREGEPDQVSETSTLHQGRTSSLKEHSMRSSSTASLASNREQDVEKGELAATNDASSPSPQTTEKVESNHGDAPPSPPANANPNPMMDPSSFPDGGTKAWLVVLGGFCSLFVSFGWINCIGVFQEYYETHELKSYSSQEIAWIPALEAFMMFIGGIWVGRLYDNYGPRWILLGGTFFHVFGLMMASISTEYYQFILSQGVCSPIGASMIFYPSMAAVVTWFFKRRGLALGCTAAGSSLGGVILPVMVEKLIPQVGFGWTMRICAFLILFLMIIANLTIVSRIPPYPKPVKVMDFLTPFSELPFALLAFGSFLTFLGLFLPFNFLILEGRARGVPDGIAIYLVSILNASSIFGRTLPGYLADRLGRFTVFVSMAFLTAIITLALWLPSSGTAAIIVFAVVFGFSSGCLVSLAPTLVAQISDVRQIGTRTGAMFSCVAIAVLIGNPVGGQLVIQDGGSYRSMQIFSGVLMLAGAVCYAALRVRIGGWKLTDKV